MATGRPLNSTTLAGLAGVGAVFLTTAVLTAITVELWFLRIVVTDGPPPRIDQLLLVTWFAGSFVAARLGGLRAVGIIGLYALGAFSLPFARLAIEAPLQCALAPHPNCSTNILDWIRVGPSWVREGLAGQLWIIPGVLLGGLMARVIRVPIAPGPGLAALSVFAVGILVANQVTFVARYTVCFPPDLVARCIDQEYLFWFAAHALVVLIVGANLGCAPKYFQRGDVLGLLGLGVLYAVLLTWASLSDTDQRRALGAITSAASQPCSCRPFRFRCSPHQLRSSECFAFRARLPCGAA